MKSLKKSITKILSRYGVAVLCLAAGLGWLQHALSEHYVDQPTTLQETPAEKVDSVTEHNAHPVDEKPKDYQIITKSDPQVEHPAKPAINQDSTVQTGQDRPQLQPQVQNQTLEQVFPYGSYQNVYVSIEKLSKRLSCTQHATLLWLSLIKPTQETGNTSSKMTTSISALREVLSDRPETAQDLDLITRNLTRTSQLALIDSLQMNGGHITPESTPQHGLWFNRLSRWFSPFFTLRRAPNSQHSTVDGLDYDRLNRFLTDHNYALALDDLDRLGLRNTEHFRTLYSAILQDAQTDQQVSDAIRHLVYACTLLP